MTERAPASAPRDLRVAIFAAGLLIALAIFGAGLGTDPDEEYALATTAHGLAYALYRAVTFELQAPLWFGIVALWRALNSAVFFARLFSELCVVTTCFVLRAIAIRVNPRINPLWFVALVALNPFAVYAAFEIRLYAFALLLAALMWLTFYDGFLEGDRLAARVWFTVVAVAGIYVLYYSGFMLVGGLVALLVGRRFRALLAYVAVWLLAALAATPAWALVGGQLGPIGAVLAGSSALPLRLLAEPVAQFLLPYSYDWHTEPRFAVLRTLYKAALIACAALAIAARPRLRKREWALLAMPLAIWLTYLGAYEFAHVQYEVPRHFVVLFVPLAAAAYAVIGAMQGRAARFSIGALTSLYVAFCGATLWTTYAHLTKPGDWPRVGAYLNARVAPSDVVAVFAPDALPALLRSYRGPAPAVAFPRPANTQRYDPSGYTIGTKEAALSAVSSISRGRRLWLVIYGPCTAAVTNYGCWTLAGALGEHYPGAAIVHFYGSEVVELDAPAGAVR